MKKQTAAHLLNHLLVALFVVLLGLPPRAWPEAPVAHAADGEPAAPGLHLLTSSEEATVLELSTPAYTLVDVQGVDGPCQRIQVEGYPQAGEPGAPQLPVKTTLLGIPPGAEVQVEVTPLEQVELPGFHRLCPSPQPTREDGENGVVRYIEKDIPADPSFYGQNRLYPADLVRYAELGYLRSQRIGRVQIAPFQYNPVTGVVVYSKRVQVRLRYSGGLVLRSARAQEPAAVESTLRASLLNYQEARAWRGNPPLAAAANNGWMPPSPAFRLYVKEEGLYAVSFAELQAAGAPVQGIDPQTFRLFHDGQEMALRVVNRAGEDDVDGSFDPGDAILFYGQGVDEKYTDANVYWLTYGGTSGLRMVNKFGSPSGEPVESYRATVHWEQNLNYVSTTPRASGYNHWYGQLLTAVGAGNQDSKLSPLEVSSLAPGSASASLEVAFAGRTRGFHHVRLYVNNTLVGEGQWQNAGYHKVSAAFDQSLLREGVNSVKMELVNDLDRQTVSVAYVDWVELTYQRRLAAQQDRLIFDSPGQGTWTYTVSGFSAAAEAQDVELYDVTDPYRVSHLDVQVNKGQVSFGALESTPRRYLLQRTTQRLAVAAITRANSRNLLDSGLGADLIVISHPDFLGAIQPLVDYRRRRGYRVQLVNVQDIYDQFGYGRVSAEAIRDFLAYAYRNWQPPAPAYVLLVGDGTYDPRRYRQDSGPTFIPPYLEVVDPDLGETAADNRYVTIVGQDTIPDMSLGRFPVETPAQATAMVQKTMAYETVPIDDGWNRNVLFTADDRKGGGGAFYNFSNAVADGTVRRGGAQVPILPSAYQKTKLYLGQDCFSGDECRQQIIDSINQGVFLVSYVGHSAKQNWAEEQLLNVGALEQLHNKNRYPIMVPMTCLEGYYHEADRNNAILGESIVRQANAGAVATWSATGLGLVTGHDYLETGFFLAIFHDGWRTLGDATSQGKLYLALNAPIGKYDDLLDTFVLLGDPTLLVRTAGFEPVQDTQSVFLPTVLRSGNAAP